MGRKPLRDVDTQRHVDFVRAVVWCLVPSVILERVVFGGPLWFALFSGLGLSLILGWAISTVADHAGDAATTLLVPTSTNYVHGYSEQDTLVIRGRITDAADSYRTLIAMDATDVTARVRLAALLTDQLRDWGEAERWYLDARSMNPDEEVHWTISNGLIDLYRVSGQREKLKAELTRMSYRYRHTTAGADARAHLQALTREESEAAS